MTQGPLRREQHLKILSNIEYAGDVEWVILVEVVKRSLKVFWPDLPYTHEDQLVIRMNGKEHCKEFVGIL